MHRKYWKAKDLEHLRALNILLRDKEMRILDFYQSLIPRANEMVAQGKIDDYVYYWNLAVFSSNDECNSRHKVAEGDPIYSDKSWRPIIRNKDIDSAAGLERNWNKYRDSENHPLAKEDFCYTMHCILFDADISIDDILAIDDVWLEVKVNYQWLTKNLLEPKTFISID